MNSPCASKSSTHLIDEEHAWHDGGLALLPPLVHLRVDLLSDLGLDLACDSQEVQPGTGRWNVLTRDRDGEGRQERWKRGSRAGNTSACTSMHVRGNSLATALHYYTYRRLTSVTSEEGQEALAAAVDDVDLVQRHHVHHLLTLLQLALRALYKSAGERVEN